MSASILFQKIVAGLDRSPGMAPRHERCGRRAVAQSDFAAATAVIASTIECAQSSRGVTRRRPFVPGRWRANRATQASATSTTGPFLGSGPRRAPLARTAWEKEFVALRPGRRGVPDQGDCGRVSGLVSEIADVCTDRPVATRRRAGIAVSRPMPWPGEVLAKAAQCRTTHGRDARSLARVLRFARP